MVRGARAVWDWDLVRRRVRGARAVWDWDLVRRLYPELPLRPPPVQVPLMMEMAPCYNLSLIRPNDPSLDEEAVRGTPG